MSRKSMFAGAVACLLLSGCGGGGDAAGPAFIPPPPENAQKNSTLTDIRYSETFGGNAAVVQYKLSRTTGAATLRTPNATSSTDGAAIRFDPASQTYTVTTGILAPVSFGSANKVAERSNGTLTSYEKSGGGVQENLVLFNPGAGNAQIALTYTSYGAYQRIADNGDLDVDTAFFAFGIRTTADQMPRSGSATYTTQIDGQFADPTGAYVLGGDSDFAADFSSSTFSFYMRPVGQHVVSGQLKYFDDQRINGQIQAGAAGGHVFTGNNHGRPGYSAAVGGYFYGPNAAEIGGTFTLTGNDGFGVGAVVGKKN